MNSDAATVEASVGYNGPAYAQALAHVGYPRLLVASGGWCLIRAITGTSWHDAVGPYPFLTCRDWAGLPADLEDLAADAITATFVTDPLGAASIGILKRAFPDLCRPYKEHAVADLGGCPTAVWSSHHKRNVARGLRETEVTLCEQPHVWLDDWIELYAELIDRHEITGPAAFSAASFRLQFSIDGLLVVRASQGGKTLGMTLWFVDGDRAYYHLGAVNEHGRHLRAMFAMFAIAFEELGRRGVTRVCLGAGAGTHAASTGLERFKRGWVSRTVPAYLCGRILDREACSKACSLAGTKHDRFFPPYRHG